MKFHQSLSLSTAVLVSISCLPGICADLFAAGQQSYAKKQYTQASTQLNNHLVRHPEDPIAHYYLGCSFVQLRRTEDALKQFEKAIELAPKSQVALYSSEEIARLSGKTADDSIYDEKKIVTSTVNTSKQLQASPQPALKSDVATAVMNVNRQTDDNEKRIQDEYAAKIQQARDSAQQRINRASKDKQDELTELGKPFYRKGYQWVPDTKPVTEEYTRTVDEINKETERKISELNIECKNRIDLLEHFAVEASQAYSKHEMVGASRSNPASSNLHIHNYEVESEVSGNPIPLIATPQSIPSTKKSAH